jgi:dTDP-4-amino-4,6-dideoxygalactose transaminase
MEGRNSRLDGLQAAILLAKLPYLEKWTEARIAKAAAYNRRLAGTDVALPLIRANSRHVFHLYVIRSENRNSLQEKLSAADVETAIHYPSALPFLPCYSHRNFRHPDFPIASAYQNSILSIPLFAELEEEQIEYICSVIKEHAHHE